jgi:hypothetical protein
MFKNHEAYTWCDYEVHGIILLRDLKGAVRLVHTKDMSKGKVILILN